MTTKQLLWYVPVIHAGYERILADATDLTEVLVMGRSFHERFPVLKKDIRAVDPLHIARDLRLRRKGTHIRVVELGELPKAIFADEVIVPRETMMEELVTEFKLDLSHIVTYVNTFLRWDKRRTEANALVASAVEVQASTLISRNIDAARLAAQVSPDWWRQVGGIIFSNGVTILTAINRHYPSDYSSYVDGDPRSNASRGEKIDLSLALHAEMRLIAEAARKGLRLEGTTLLVTTFPCPNCARAIAVSGIKGIYYTEGYAMLDGEAILINAGISLYHISK
jgi:dCMP deaminase